MQSMYWTEKVSKYFRKTQKESKTMESKKIIDNAFLTQLGIKPVAKQRSKSRMQSDVNIAVFKRGSKDDVNVIRIAIEHDSYQLAFGKEEYLQVGLANAVNRLYFWPSDSHKGFKFADPNKRQIDYSKSSLYAKSTTFYEVLKDYFTNTSEKNLELKYEPAVGLYYVYLGEVK